MVEAAFLTTRLKSPTSVWVENLGNVPFALVGLLIFLSLSVCLPVCPFVCVSVDV